LITIDMLFNDCRVKGAEYFYNAIEENQSLECLFVLPEPSFAVVCQTAEKIVNWQGLNLFIQNVYD